MDKEIELLKKEIKELKNELENRPTKEEVEKMISDWASKHIPTL